MKMEKNNNKINPSARVKEFVSTPLKKVSSNKTDKPSVINNNIGICFLMTLLLILKGLIKIASPRMTRILLMLLPITLPKSISAFPDRCELNEIASSGAEVPNATIVKPIIIVDILKFRAKETDPSTKRSAHLIRMMNPRITNTIFNSTFKTPSLNYQKNRLTAGQGVVQGQAIGRIFLIGVDYFQKILS